MSHILLFGLSLISRIALGQGASTATPQLVWKATSGPDVPLNATFGRGVAVDQQGNTYQVATTFQPLSCPFAIINKYDKDGNAVWSVNFLPGGQCSSLNRIAVDPSGFIYVIGTQTLLGNNTSTNQLVLQKLSFAGNLIWSQTFVSSGTDSGVGVAFDQASGSVYALDGTCESTQACWLRYDQNGNLLFRQTVSFPDSFRETGVALTARNNTITVLTGSSPNFPNLNVTRVTRYNLNGSVVWTNNSLLPPDISFNGPQDIVEDPNGNLVVAESVSILPPPGNAFSLVRYSDQGQILLAITDQVLGDIAFVAATDAGGNLYGAGQRIPGSGGFLVEKYDPTGKPIWRIDQRFPPASSAVNGIAIDSSGNLYLSGFVGGAHQSLVAQLAKYSIPQTVQLEISLNPSSVPPLMAGTTIASQTQVLVRAVDNSGNAVSGQSLKLDALPPIFGVSLEDQLGGHDHDGSRPVGLFVGGNCVSMTGSTCLQSEIVCVIDNNGNCRANNALPIYVASAFGGKEKIQASLANDPSVSTSTLLAVRVEDGLGNPLQLLPDSPTVYMKTGGTQFHLGPPSNATDNNHYGTQNFNTIISSVSAQFKAQFPNRTVLVNDMSLSFGGLFDIGPTGTCFLSGNACPFWDIPHTFHRLGTSCDYNLDIGLTNILNSKEAIFLYNLLTKAAGLKVWVEGNHWHIYLPGGGP